MKDQKKQRNCTSLNIIDLFYGRENLSILIGSFLVRILPYGPFSWKRSSAVYFLFSKADKFKTSMARMPYNKQLTNLASSSHTGEYWPSVVFVQTSSRSIRTPTTSGQYSPVQPLRSFSKKLVFYADAISKHFILIKTSLTVSFQWPLISFHKF